MYHKVGLTEESRDVTRFLWLKNRAILSLKITFKSIPCVDIGRGVVIYSKSKLQAQKPVINDNFREQVWCKINLKNKKSLLVGCMYRSPNATKENLTELIQLLNDICSTKTSHLLIVGDFNCKEINWKVLNTIVSEEHMASVFLEAAKGTYLFQHVKENTKYRTGNE